KLEAAKPWPELAQFDCFSCHHSVQPKGWRQADNRNQGSLVWSHWYDGLSPDILTAIDKKTEAPKIAETWSDFVKLRAELTSNLSSPKPRRDIAVKASDLSKELLQTAAQLNGPR